MYHNCYHKKGAAQYLPQQRGSLPDFSRMTSANIIMIIDFLLDCKHYPENIFDSSSLYPYQCTECGSRKMIRYGTYERYVLLFNGAGFLETRPLKVQRLLCSCGRTHALLPGDVVPFHHYNYIPMVNLLLILLYGSAEGQEPMIQKLDRAGVSYQTVRCFLSIYRLREEELLSMLRINGWYEQGAMPSSGSILKAACGLPPPAMQKEYFRLFRRPLFLNRRNTASYPLYFCVRDFR